MLVMIFMFYYHKRFHDREFQLVGKTLYHSVVITVVCITVVTSMIIFIGTHPNYCILYLLYL